jgi:hypothetical protein
MRFFLLAACILSAQLSPGVTLGWNPSPSAGVAGYRIYYGTSSGIYKGLLDAGNVTTTSVSGLAAGVTYYFTVVAYNANVVLSDFSNEISYAVPAGSTPAVDGTGGSGSGSTDGTTANPPAGSSYLTSKSLGTLHNDFSGFAGMQIVVGPAPIAVSALGHLFVSGNSRAHTVKLVNASDGTDVPGGSVSIVSSGTGGQFQYATLSKPVVLSAGAAYYVVSSESSGGDSWYYSDTRVTTTSAAAELSAVWGYGAGQWYVNGAAGQSYVPIDFKYTTVTASKSARYVTSEVLGSLRSSYSGYAGMQILVGSSPIAVTGLGRMAAPGNGGTHLLKLVDASDGTDVPGGAATVSMSGAIAGQFQYANLSGPVLLLPKSAYYVLSQETATGDTWYYNDSTVQTTSVASEISGAWGYGLGNGTLMGVPARLWAT